MADLTADVVVIGAGIAGVSAAFHLAMEQDIGSIVICDPRPPLSLTSDKSSECYRNWWPGPDDTMVSLMERSIDLLDRWAVHSGDVFNLNRRGYLYVTDDLDATETMRAQAEAISGLGAGTLRTADDGYHPHTAHGFDPSLRGADLFSDGAALRSHFPYLSPSIVGGLHVRRAGWFSAQQLGAWLLEQARSRGVDVIPTEVMAIETSGGVVSGVGLASGESIATSQVVIAAGPMLDQVAGLLGEMLPVHSEIHRKISFRDHLGAVPRDAPLLVWNQGQRLSWEPDVALMLESDPQLSSLLDLLPAGAHCRPDGPSDGNIALGLWEYRTEVRTPEFPLPEDPMYPEMVIRGLTAMLPAMEGYLDRLPQPYVDGGYYTKTDENRPLIGPLATPGAWVVGAMSGYGVMASPAAGELVASHLVGGQLPGYARWLRPDRYEDPEYQAMASSMTDHGQL